MNLKEFERLLIEAGMKPIEAIMSVRSKNIHYFVAYDENENQYYVYDKCGMAFKYNIEETENIDEIPFSINRVSGEPVKEHALPCV